ncbi:MAG TPA: trypsin-like peptidase domain-containing protein [Micromonosporaceae bacterium]
MPDLPRGPVAGAAFAPTPGFRPAHDGYGRPSGEWYGQPPGQGYDQPSAESYGQPPGQGYDQPPSRSYGQWPGQPSGYPAAPPPQPIASAAPTAVELGPPAAHRSWSSIATRLLALALIALLGWQAYQIDRLSGRLQDLERARAADAARAGGLDGRLGELEQQAGKAFNPEAISAAVLPSVFRVSAGPVTGTAFAVGKPAAGGGTNLFTNWHVVEAVFQRGERKVFLERTGQRFPATIVRVDKEHDVAHLRTDARFTGLRAAPASAKSGQPIVVVGAPLGLEDSVTTGVVSAQRSVPELAGPMIQFDAPINPGNSGGPVVNGAKQVVGIATAKQRDAEGIGLAVPIKTACDQFHIC